MVLICRLPHALCIFTHEVALSDVDLSQMRYKIIANKAYLFFFFNRL